MKNKKYFENKGFTTTDIIIAIIIIVIFVSIITTSFYNYYISAQGKNRISMASNIAIDVIENIEMMDYDSINQNSVNSTIENLKNNGTISNSYNVTATISKYNETMGNTNKYDLIKILSVKVTYLLNEKEESYDITRLIKNRGRIV